MDQPENDVPTGKVFGGPVEDDRLTPLQGRWTFVSHEYEDPNPDARISTGKDLTVRGHVIQFGEGQYLGELRLCNVHEHDGRICSEGWYHPYVDHAEYFNRMQCTPEVKGGELILRLRRIPDSGYVGDPVFSSANDVCTAAAEIDGATSWFVLRYAKYSK